MRERPFYIVLTAACLLALPGMVHAQDKEHEEEREKEVEVHIVRAREQLEEQKKQMEQHQKQMQHQFRDKYEEIARKALEASRYNHVYVGEPPAKDPPFFVYSSVGQENSTQLTLRKVFKGNTENSDGTFDVEEGIRHFRCMISGTVNSGEISIRVNYPGGDEFKELSINSSADISYSQSITFNEDEGEKYVGEWTYEIDAKDAEGHYKLQIITN